MKINSSRSKQQDQSFFFGREAVVQRLMDKLKTSRFLAVLGPSGCGKSSVVQAGLIPHLREKALVTLFAPREQPIEELAFALRKCYLENKRPPVEQLIERLKGPVMVILTMRSDFMGKCAFYPDLNTYVSEHFFQVEPMSQEELRSAIEEPARLTVIDFETGLVNRILEDIKGAPGELPLLEHALLELYEMRKGKQITLQAYEEIGGIEGALVKRAESEFAKLDDKQKEILRKMFVMRLIQPGEGTEDTRRRATKEELLAIGGDVKVKKVLEQWINARLLTITNETTRGQVLIDVAHEALIRKWGKIHNWMAEGRKSARLTGILKQAVLEWKQANRSLDFLFEGARLVQMEGLVNNHADNLTEDEIEFVKTCVKLRDAKEREEKELRKKELQTAQELAAAKSKAVKRTRIIIVVLLLFLISVIFLAYNLNLKEKRVSIEKKEVQLQLARNYWEKSRRYREDEKEFFAYHLVAEAIEANTGNPIGKPMVHKDSVYGARFTSNETRIISWSADGTVRIWDIGVDWDFPKNKIKLQIWALTGTRLNTTTMEIEFIEPDEWRKIKGEYMEFAKKHYMTCKFPKANVFRKLFPEEAKKIRKKE